MKVVLFCGGLGTKQWPPGFLPVPRPQGYQPLPIIGHLKAEHRMDRNRRL
jgi:hypothetical protein